MSNLLFLRALLMLFLCVMPSLMSFIPGAGGRLIVFVKKGSDVFCDPCRFIDHLFKFVFLITLILKWACLNHHLDHL